MDCFSTGCSVKNHRHHCTRIWKLWKCIHAKLDSECWLEPRTITAWPIIWCMSYLCDGNALTEFWQSHARVGRCSPSWPPRSASENPCCSRRKGASQSCWSLWVACDGPWRRFSLWGPQALAACEVPPAPTQACLYWNQKNVDSWYY